LILNPNNNLNLLKIHKIVTKNKKKNIYISISETYIEFLSKKIYTPYKLPMLIMPIKWNNQQDGGYLTNDYKKFANISLLHKSYKTISTSEISDIQIDTINFLNKQKLKINKEMLYLLVKEYYNKDSILYNGLNQLHPESKEDKTYNKLYSKKVLSHNSKYMLYNQVLSMAILYQNVSFYQTTFYDFRGRIYANSDYFSYQSEDMSKSLIEFEEGCNLDDSNIKYVLQCLANLGGKSKLTIENKEK
jgi:DNA-directed RNA polymerase